MKTSSGELKSKFWVFQLSKLITFEVNYYRLGSNKNKYFTTSAGKFIKSKRDWEQGGQCQDSVLTGKALNFYKKWDIHHLEDLTEELYIELLKDIEELKEKYNFLEKTEETDKNFRFYELVEFSKQKPKNRGLKN